MLFDKLQINTSEISIQFFIKNYNNRAKKKVFRKNGIKA
jgi:hypothetical protein